MHKVSANNISKTQVLKKMGLRKAVGKDVLQDDGYTQSYITIRAVTEGSFTNEWLKYSASQCITMHHNLSGWWSLQTNGCHYLHNRI